MVEPDGKLFWSGILFSVDVPFTAQWRLRPTSDLFADQTTLIQSDIFSATSNVTTYRAKAYIPNPTISELRSTSTEYPEAILTVISSFRASYLNESVKLALDITNGKNNPYEKAKAIEVYLRANYPYDLEVPAPPSYWHPIISSLISKKATATITPQPWWCLPAQTVCPRALFLAIHPVHMMHPMPNM